MKVSENFDIREFVPRSIWNRFGEKSIWFIRPEVIKIAQAYKDLFTTHYQSQHKNVASVAIKINDWMYGGGKQFSGFRPPESNIGAALSQHRFGNAFDCEIIIVYKDGTRKEADYAEVHRVVKANWAYLSRIGLTTIESLKDAAGWLHSDCRNTGSKELLIVNA